MLPAPVETFFITTAKALQTVGGIDSTNRAQIDSKVTGAAVDFASENDILSRLHSVLKSETISQHFRPRARLERKWIVALSASAVLLLLIPWVVRRVLTRSLQITMSRPIFRISGYMNDQTVFKRPVYPGQRLTIGSSGNIPVEQLPRLALEFKYDKRMTANVYTAATLNGVPAKKSVILKASDNLLIEDKLLIRVESLSTGGPTELESSIDRSQKNGK